MRSTLVIVSTTALSIATASCGSSSSAPISAPSSTVTVAGNWSGTGVDSQGAIYVSWALTQTGNTISGTVKTQATDPADGTCNSCHRNKSGTISGTITGTTLTMTMFFAAGVDGDPTPACTATLTGMASTIAAGALSGEYSGGDSCEGPFTDGTLGMVRHP